jgi:hypothetical protein
MCPDQVHFNPTAQDICFMRPITFIHEVPSPSLQKKKKKKKKNTARTPLPKLPQHLSKARY